AGGGEARRNRLRAGLHAEGAWLMPLSGALRRIVTERERFDGAFLYCRDCLAVHRITDGDRAPLLSLDGSVTPVDDFRKFLLGHVDHRLLLLKRSSDSEVLSHARWDPMCRIAWEVTDGESSFVVSAGRTDLEGPREYAIAPGRLVLERESIDIDVETLRHEIDQALFPHSAPPKKISALVEACRRLVAGLDADTLDVRDEAREDPSVQLACLPPSVAALLRREVQALFAFEEAARLLEVIDTDLVNGIPIIRLERRYRIESGESGGGSPP
ncbi:MAG: hypothetical protein ACREQ9_00340, partial [Candidatus Binatia bacterium]